MKVRKLQNPTAEKFVKETLALITEKGGSKDVNLREVSKRVGCAHTNAYNYFDGFEGLLWAAFERTIYIYADAIEKDLNNDLSSEQYFTMLISNLVEFVTENPGLYRFIGSDPIDLNKIPQHLITLVSKLKDFLIEVIYTLSSSRLTRKQAREVTDIILAYLDGETFNLINQRYLPDDNIHERILKNVTLLFTRLTANTCDGIVLENDNRCMDFPKLDLDSKY